MPVPRLDPDKVIKLLDPEYATESFYRNNDPIAARNCEPVVQRPAANGHAPLLVDSKAPVSDPLFDRIDEPPALVERTAPVPMPRRILASVPMPAVPRPSNELAGIPRKLLLLLGAAAGVVGLGAMGAVFLVRETPRVDTPPQEIVPVISSEKPNPSEPSAIAEIVPAPADPVETPAALPQSVPHGRPRARARIPAKSFTPPAIVRSEPVATAPAVEAPPAVSAEPLLPNLPAAASALVSGIAAGVKPPSTPAAKPAKKPPVPIRIFQKFKEGITGGGAKKPKN